MLLRKKRSWEPLGVKGRGEVDSPRMVLFFSGPRLFFEGVGAEEVEVGRGCNV